MNYLIMNVRNMTRNLHVVIRKVFFPHKITGLNILLTPIPVAARFKAWVCGQALAGIAGSNPAGHVDVWLL
jgi:hypothetical protein